MKRYLFSFLIATMTSFAWAYSAPVAILAKPTTPQAQLLFIGDIMLSREVEHEIHIKYGATPWMKMRDAFMGYDVVMGNLEGSVGTSEECLGRIRELCFATKPSMVNFIKQAGFNAIGVENNHSADLGEQGRGQTIAALNSADITPVDYQDSPAFYRAGNDIFAIIAVNNVKGVDGKKVEIPENNLRQKIRIARSLANWVIVFVHWGVELVDWVEPSQRRMAQWLTAQGADVIIGSHPHVIEAPECIRGKPVFYSLGNHVFDQKYPVTKLGLMVDCRENDGMLSCGGLATVTPPSSSFPLMADKSRLPANLQSWGSGTSCRVPRHSAFVVNGYQIRPRLSNHQFVSGDLILQGSQGDTRPWNASSRRILTIDSAAFVPGHKFLFTLEQHKSSIDQEIGPRPYVYEVTSHGLVALWRGSALAWPLIDAGIIHSERGSDVLCALHRKDSFLLLNPNSQETRIAVYKWNGFGFTGIDDKKLKTKCESYFS